jgi:hypothetical protein
MGRPRFCTDTDLTGTEPKITVPVQSSSDPTKSWEEVSTMLPAFTLVTRDAVAENLIGARAGDPVVPDVERPPRRTRIRAAEVLRHVADRLAPAEPRPAH